MCSGASLSAYAQARRVPLRAAARVDPVRRLDELYRNHGHYVSAVVHTDQGNLDAGYLLPADARENLNEAAQSDVGKK
jgi:alpha/beta hydrolase family protein